MYEQGQSLVDIANKLGIPAGTVRGWKSKDQWDSGTAERSGAFRDKAERSNSSGKKNRGVELGDALNDAQKLFCEIFVRNRNATMAYMQSHPGCAYNTASVNGYESLRKTKIKAYIDYLRDLKSEAIRLCPDDIVEKYMKIAFSNMSDFATWGFNGIDNQLAAMPSEMVDTGLVSEVSKSDKGFRIKLEDRQKALEWLASWFGMNPMDRHKIDFDKKRLELEERKLQTDGGTDEDDGVIINYGPRNIHRGSSDTEADAGVPG